MKLLLGVGAGDDAGAALEAVVSRAREADDDLTVAVYAGDGADRDVETVKRRVRDHLDDLRFGRVSSRSTATPGVSWWSWPRPVTTTGSSSPGAPGARWGRFV